MSNKKPCIYGLHQYCIVHSNLAKERKDVSNWGSTDWIKLHCSLCIKATYAKSRLINVKGFSVVNTL